jgi:hypothetical protein
MACNCNDYPFEPDYPCYDICAGRMITYSSPDELKNVFRIPENILQKLLRKKTEGTAQTLSDYSEGLDEPEVYELHTIFSNLNQEAIDLFKEKRGSSSSDNELEEV